MVVQHTQQYRKLSSTSADISLRDSTFYIDRMKSVVKLLVIQTLLLLPTLNSTVFHVLLHPTPSDELTLTFFSQSDCLISIRASLHKYKSLIFLLSSTLSLNPRKMAESTGVVAVYGEGSMTETKQQSPFSVKVGLAQMLRGGVIMDVVNAEQARIAEEAGACAVMALERVPADIRAQGGVARMSDDQRDQTCRYDSGHGQSSDRPLRGGADPRVHRSRLRRRE